MENHRDFDTYNKIIKYKTLEVAVNQMIDKAFLPTEFHIFYDEIIENFKKNYDKIILDVTGMENGRLSTGMYSLSIKMNYEVLRAALILKGKG